MFLCLTLCLCVNKSYMKNQDKFCLADESGYKVEFVPYLFILLVLLYSPEHPLYRARGRSMLSGDRKSFRDYSDDIATSRCFLCILSFLLPIALICSFQDCDIVQFFFEVI